MAGGGEGSRGEQACAGPRKQEAAGTLLPRGQVQDSGRKMLEGWFSARPALLWPGHWSRGPRRARGVCILHPLCLATLSVPGLAQAAQPVLQTFGDPGSLLLVFIRHPGISPDCDSVSSAVNSSDRRQTFLMQRRTEKMCDLSMTKTVPPKAFIFYRNETSQGPHLCGPQPVLGVSKKRAQGRVLGPLHGDPPYRGGGRLLNPHLFPEVSTPSKPASPFPCGSQTGLFIPYCPSTQGYRGAEVIAGDNRTARGGPGGGLEGGFVNSEAGVSATL